MDKNTLTGLLLMGLILFGFMYCNRDAEQQAQQQTEQAADNKKEAAASASAPGADPAVELRKSLNDLVAAKGIAMDDGVKHLSENGLELSADSMNNLSGTVTVGTKAYDVAAIFSNDTAVMSDGERANAIGAINVHLENVRNLGPLAVYKTGRVGKTVTVDNGKMKVTFNSDGGRISQVVLNDYKTETTETPTDICMFNRNTAEYGFTLQTDKNRIRTQDLVFDLEQPDRNTVLMKCTVDPKTDTWFGIKYTVVPGEYIVKMDIVQSNFSSVVPSTRRNITFDWRLKMARNEKGRTFEQQKSAVYYKLIDESPDDLDANSDDEEDVKGNVKWVAFKNQFFSSVIIARGNFANPKLVSKDLKDSPDYLKDMSMSAQIDYNSSAANGPGFDFYFGPNEYSILSSLDDKVSPDSDLELTRLIPLGWGIFRWINTWVIVPVFNLLEPIGNYGIIILLLTIFIKIIIFPFTYKSYMSQARMRVLQPEIKEINEKYPGNENAMKRQQETMKLYSKAGASPFSGCLPMLLQMPVLIAMFWFFPSAIELRGQSFLWAHDLSAPDTIFTLPFTIPFYGNHVSLFCLLMTVVNVIYTRINMQNQPGGSSMPGMKWMMYLMPVMFLFFFNDYASGLSYYYFLSLLITIIQTYIFRRVVDEDKVRAQMAANAKKPKKKSGFMARLEAAQKKQEAMMREQAKQRAGQRRR